MKSYTNWKAQKGAAESKAPMIITILILLILGFLSYKFIPAKWRNMKFRQNVEEILNIDYAREYRTKAAGGFNEFTMRQRILDAASKYGIKIPEKELHVTRPKEEIFRVELRYWEIISLPLMKEPYRWEFTIFMETDPHAGKAIAPE
ncbi:hypothetical protein JW979_07040 [bacterium]|nr:hypothetical protein [candidate division CSSED10-310 bacterium]